MLLKFYIKKNVFYDGLLLFQNLLNFLSLL